MNDTIPLNDGVIYTQDEKVQNFINALCSLIQTANQVHHIPVEIIYLNLQVHAHDIMTHIVNSSMNYSIEQLKAVGRGDN